MVLNYIWIGFFIVAFLFALFRVLGYFFRDFFADTLGMVFDQTDLNAFKDIMDSVFSMAEFSVMKICLPLIGVMALWLGIMKIGEKAGVINKLARLVGPFFNKLFPELPKNHPAFGSIIMNFSANMLGLDNAATPLGLKAMDQLQEANKDKKRASNAMIMFLVLNTSGLTLIPISVMMYRASNGAANPADVFLPILLATYCASLVGLIVVSIYQKINLFNKTILLYLGSITLLLGIFVTLLLQLNQDQINKVGNLVGNSVIFAVIVLFLWFGLRKKVDLWPTFIEGAKEGFQVAIKIIPYLVGMLVGIAVFRASGALDIIIDGFKHFFALFLSDTRFVDAFPTALMKPLSGGGARGAMLESFEHFGVDNFVAKLSATLQGSTETTFYTIAVYYGAVGIKKIRYTIGAGLLADLAGIIAAIVIAYIFFG
jgi:spore maturation protein SpmA